MNEQDIKQQLIAKLGIPEDKVVVQRERRIFAEIPREKFESAFKFIVNDLKFVILCTITGTDETANFGVLYHLATEKGIVLTVRILIPRDNPVLNTVTGTFPSAILYEREMTDLLGIQMHGLPEGQRYPLPDDWPKNEYPLRKDWKQKAPSAPREERGTSASKADVKENKNG
ncbi:MAG: NADH-quinone oxidoreductase subunit C [Elusimicrobiota bacterium]